METSLLLLRDMSHKRYCSPTSGTDGKKCVGFESKPWMPSLRIIAQMEYVYSEELLSYLVPSDDLRVSQQYLNKWITQ